MSDLKSNLSHQLELLTQIKAKIENPKHWTQYSSAKNKSGKPCNATSEDAVCWCILGAMDAVILPLNLDIDFNYLIYKRLKAQMPDGCVSSFNDKHTHEEVMELLSKTITELNREIKLQGTRP